MICFGVEITLSGEQQFEDESDSDFELTKPVTKAKGKEFDLFKKVAGANGSKREAASTIATKKAKINDDSDDDLYAVD